MIIAHRTSACWYCSALKSVTVVRKMVRHHTGDGRPLIATLTDKIDNSGSSVVENSLLLLWFAEISFDVLFLKIQYCLLLSFALELFLFLSHSLINHLFGLPSDSFHLSRLSVVRRTRIPIDIERLNSCCDIVRHYHLRRRPVALRIASEWRLPHRWWLVFADGSDRKRPTALITQISRAPVRLTIAVLTTSYLIIFCVVCS